MWCVGFVLVGKLCEGGESVGVGMACESPRCGWLVWGRVPSCSLGVGGRFV